MTLKRIIGIFILLEVFALFLSFVVKAQTPSQVVKGEIKTVYDVTTGRPVNQSQDAKGYHWGIGTVKLVTGRASVSINTSTADEAQDMSFISASTYRGSVWSSDTSNAFTYTVRPIDGQQFLIVSSSGTDTSTVNYFVEGE